MPSAYTNIPKPTDTNWSNVAKPTDTTYTNVAKPSGVFLIVRGMYMGPLGLTYSKNYVTDVWTMVIKPQY